GRSASRRCSSTTRSAATSTSSAASTCAARARTTSSRPPTSSSTRCGRRTTAPPTRTSCSSPHPGGRDMSAVKLKAVDVVVVGTGAAGGTAVWPLAKAGLKVVAVEAGPRVTESDYPFDEIRNDIRDWMGQWKANREVPTARLNSSQQATRPLGATGPMMNAVGGTSIHWMTQSWRYNPWNFNTRSEAIKRYGPNAIPKGSTVADWPFDYAELEQYYDKVEYRHGVSGQAGNVKGAIDPRGNIFEGPRARAYPN